MRRTLRATGLVLIWALIAAVLLEAALRLLYPVLPAHLTVGARRITGDTGSAGTILGISMWDRGLVLRPDLVEASVSVSPAVRFHVTTRRLFDSAFGFRTHLPDAPVTIAVVGDSYGFCFTEEADCWVPLLSAASGRTAVNLSQPGTSGQTHWRMIDEYARSLQPPVVLWVFSQNDFNEAYGQAVNNGEIAPIDEPPLVVDPGLEPSVAPLVKWLRGHSVAFTVIESALVGDWAYLDDFQRLFVAPYKTEYRDGALEFGQPYTFAVGDMTRPHNAAGVPLYRDALVRARSAVESWGGALVVVMIPPREMAYEHLTRPVLGEERYTRLGASYDTMRALCVELGLTCFDTLPGFASRAQAGEHLYYTDDPHLNPYGNGVLATLVREYLAFIGLLDAPATPPETP